eukprot:CAMPEP_0176285668 /NCGR_PEP_ID=MMETSP0121_2-20121125/52492_1 /TAXON_ID=160619 /ORGANISM="Kryptoperidinium foliaceum, Strain CCMP 1326" /LENGTH=67 /DNA_ID=CAMNT_0017626167 /DNA_START=52 /DNA_END=252 /DNA_ORIENTATION=-
MSPDCIKAGQARPLPVCPSPCVLTLRGLCGTNSPGGGDGWKHTLSGQLRKRTSPLSVRRHACAAVGG